MSVRPELVGRARSLAANGFSVIPVDATTKRPHRGYSWKPMMERPLTADQVERDIRQSNADAIAVIAGAASGGLLVIDFDVAGFYERWLADVEQYAATLPAQRTGGGGYQVFLRCDEPGPNMKLAWAKSETEPGGREIAIETRGDGGYALVAPSSHPTGNRYEMLDGPKLIEIPHVEMDVVALLIEYAKGLDEIPTPTSETNARTSNVAPTDNDPPAAAPNRQNGRAAGATSVSVIETFNAHHSCSAILQHHGYTILSNGQFRRPGKTEGISGNIARDGDGVERSTHYSSNDGANDGKFGNGLCGKHSAFDLFAILEHKGNFKRATAAAAEMLGLKYQPDRKTGAAKGSADNGGGGTIPPGSDVGDSSPAGGPAMEDSELRAAQILVEQYGSDVRFNFDRGEWLTWSGTRWHPDARAVIEQHAMSVAISSKARLRAANIPLSIADRVMRSLQSSRGINGIVRLASAQRGVRVGAAEMDRDDFALNCRNGTIDLRTGELRAHQREDLITKVCPVAFDPKAKCPVWEGHLKTIFGNDEELVGYLQRCAGLYASGDIGVEELHVWYGEGANGKSKTYEAITHVLGEYAGVAPEGLLVARGFNVEHPTEIADLMGKRFVIASETDAGGSLRMAMVKRLTGDAILKARFMHQNYFEFRRTHKAILVTNHMPKVSENTEAVWRRLRMIPFNFTIPKHLRDGNMTAKLEAEAPGILAWMVRGSVDRVKNGMQPPASVTRATDDYRGRSDTFEDFLTSELVVDKEGRITRKALAHLYAAWATRAGELEPLSPIAVYDRIRRIKGITDDRWKEDGTPARGFLGIRQLLSGEPNPRQEEMFDSAGGAP